MNAPSLPRVRAAIRRVSIGDARSLVAETLSLPTTAVVRAHLRQRMTDWQIGHLLPPQD
jgi:phosphotransferase system enzyme I (PtsP)